jgi:hypothetical protein
MVQLLLPAPTPEKQAVKQVMQRVPLTCSDRFCCVFFLFYFLSAPDGRRGSLFHATKNKGRERSFYVSITLSRTGAATRFPFL